MRVRVRVRFTVSVYDGSILLTCGEPGAASGSHSCRKTAARLMRKPSLETKLVRLRVRARVRVRWLRVGLGLG